MGLQCIIFVVSGIFSIITNLDVDGCNQTQPLYVFEQVCSPTWWTRISLVSKIQSDSYETGQEITNLVNVVLCIIFLQICRYFQRKEAFKCDVKLITVSDYSIEVSGLPVNTKVSEIRSFFEGLETVLNRKVNIVSINRSFYISDLVENTKKMEELIHEKTTCELYLTLAEKDPSAFPKVPANKKKLEVIEGQIKTILQNIKEEKKNFKDKCQFTGTAFITFDSPEESRKVKKLFEMGMWEQILIYLKKSVHIDSDLLFKGQILQVRRAPEPDDVLWENLGVSWEVKMKKRLMTTFATVSILVMSFVIILIISYFQTFIQRNQLVQGLMLTMVNSCGACLTVVINYCLNFSIERFTRLEKHSTLTNYHSALAEKKIVAVFFNTALIYILISFYFRNFVGKNGLVENLLYIYFSNMSITICLQFFDPFYMLKLYSRRKLEQDPEKSGLTQAEANALYEGPTQNIPFLFSSVVNMVLFTSFYGSLVPFGAIIGMVTLASFYWTYKYLLLRRSSVPNLLGKAMAYEMIEYAEFAPFLFALGDIIFVQIFYNEVKTINLIALGLSCINFITPMKLVNKKLMRVKEKQIFYDTNEEYKKTYKEVRREIPLEFDRCNPVTKRKATEEWVSFIENRQSRGQKERIEDEDEIDMAGMDEEILSGYLENSKDGKKGGKKVADVNSFFRDLIKIDKD